MQDPQLTDVSSAEMAEHRITLRIPAVEWTMVQARARTARVSANRWIGQAVSEALGLATASAPPDEDQTVIVVACSEQQARAIRSAARAEMRTPELYLLAAGLGRTKRGPDADD